MSVLKKNLSAQRSRETLNRLFTILLWAVWSINPRFGWYLPVLEMQNDHILLHMFLCYIMFCIHFLNISRQGRRKSRWNKRIAEQNPGGVEAGALYGGENTCQVNQNNFFLANLFSWTLGSIFDSNSHEKFFEEQSECFQHNCTCM